MRVRKIVAVNELHPLGKLIQATQDRENWSTRDMERAAERHGYSMKHSNFSRLKIEPVVTIKASQIKVLAAVLGVSEQTVAMAAIASMGIDLDSHAATLEDSLRQATDLSIRDRNLVIALVSAMQNENSESNGQQEPILSSTSTPPRLRAVAPASDAGSGQKTGLTEAEDSVTPPPIEQLAAHFPFESEHEKFERLHGSRGEENQDPTWDS